MRKNTEEGKKVERGGGEKYYCVYERVSDDVALKTNFFGGEDAAVVVEASSSK
jgi:hypothetical protein